MTRLALTLATLLTLTLNGSIALASIPGCSASVCTVSLDMMTPPPPRPQGLWERYLAAQSAVVIPVAGRE